MLFEFLHLNNQRLSSSLWRRDKFKWVAGSPFWFLSRRICICVYIQNRIYRYSLCEQCCVLMSCPLGFYQAIKLTCTMHKAHAKRNFKIFAKRCRCRMSNFDGIAIELTNVWVGVVLRTAMTWYFFGRNALIVAALHVTVTLLFTHKIQENQSWLVDRLNHIVRSGNFHTCDLRLKTQVQSTCLW